MKTYSPTTPSRRHMTNVDYSVISDVKPYKKLVKSIKRSFGRNNKGRITVRHKGGGNKRLYRMVDFKRNTFDVPSRVETIEYDPYRTCFIARVVYENGKRDYILASSSMKVGDVVVSSEKAPLKEGNRMMLKNIPIGYSVYNIEINPGRGGQVAKSAGSCAKVLASDSGYTTLKMPSSEIRKFLWDSFATLGKLSNTEHNLITIGKAGRSRWLNIRPTVRGSAMNPVDHKYGGGEGKTQRGTRRPKDIWGNVTGGKRTRNKKKWSSRLIVNRRKKR